LFTSSFLSGYRLQTQFEYLLLTYTDARQKLTLILNFTLSPQNIIVLAHPLYISVIQNSATAAVTNQLSTIVKCNISHKFSTHDKTVILLIELLKR